MQILQYSEKGLKDVGYDHYVVCVCVGDISSRGKVHLNSKNIEKELKGVLYVLPGIKHFCSYLTSPKYLIISSHSRQQ
jgi:hypothetical protein